MGIVLKVLAEQAKHICTLEPLIWTDDVLTEKDKEVLKKEAEYSQFDTLNLKKNTYNAFENGAIPIVKKTTNVRIVILTEGNQTFPWALWGRVFQWLGPPKSNIWQIYIYANSTQRILPSEGNVAAEHLNGGYTMPCNSDAVIIYRYEECTRVLIHELLHASCTDDHSLPVEYREAATETWAELFLVALLSKGTKINKIWKIQDHYIQDLNYTLSTFHNVNTVEDYGARYTTMREAILHSFSIVLDSSYKPKRITISRFTSPQLDAFIY